MRRIVKCIVLAAFTLLLAPLAQAQSVQTLYGTVVGMSGAVLVKIDPQTGLRTDVVQLSPYSAISGLALSPTGMVYTITQDPFLPSPRLLRVDPVAGTVVLVGSANYSLAVTALAFDPSGRLLGISGIFGQNGIVQIDPATGTTLSLGQVSGMSPTEHVEGMAFDSSGFLYAVTYDPGSGPGMPPSPPQPIRIIRIDTSTLPLQAADVVTLVPQITLTGLAIEQVYKPLGDPELPGQVWGVTCSVGAVTSMVKINLVSGVLTTTAPVSPAATCVHGLVFTGVPADTTAPTASPTQSPAANAAGWNNSNVTVTWNWTDNVGGSGIDPANCTANSTSSGEGTITLNAICKDRAGNTGNASYTVKVDKTSPTVTYSGNVGSYTVDGTVNITCTPADALSGIASSTCSGISGAAYVFGLGTHAYAASATDNAGNIGGGTTTFTVVLTPAGLDSLITRFFGGDAAGANGLIDKVTAIVSAPNAKAKANILNAFNNQVDAKIGKPLTADQGALLKLLAASL